MIDSMRTAGKIIMAPKIPHSGSEKEIKSKTGIVYIIDLYNAYRYKTFADLLLIINSAINTKIAWIIIAIGITRNGLFKLMLPVIDLKEIVASPFSLFIDEGTESIEISFMAAPGLVKSLLLPRSVICCSESFGERNMKRDSFTTSHTPISCPLGFSKILVFIPVCLTYAVWSLLFTLSKLTDIPLFNITASPFFIVCVPSP